MTEQPRRPPIPFGRLPRIYWQALNWSLIHAAYGDMQLSNAAWARAELIRKATITPYRITDIPLN